jgi:hypothetical protein
VTVCAIRGGSLWVYSWWKARQAAPPQTAPAMATS